MLPSIVIVNYKSSRLILDCLHSIYRQGQEEFEVIVVDNSDDEEGRKAISGSYPVVKWIRMEYNAGFARANNAGIRAAAGDIILLLNPDTLVEDNAIAECAARLRSSEYVAAGVQLLNTDRSPQITGNYFMTGGLNHLMALPIVGRLIRWLGYRLKVKKTNVASAEGLVEVDWINGAFLMVKRTAIDKAGLLDEDFFLYAEEIEWCSRLRRIGKLCVYGDLHTLHLQGESANDAFGSSGKGYYNLSDRKGYQIMLSGLVRIRKQFGAGWFIFHLAAYLFTVPVYLLATIIRTLFLQPGRKREWANWWGFSVNVLGICGFVPVILSKKPHFYKVL